MTSLVLLFALVSPSGVDASSVRVSVANTPHVNPATSTVSRGRGGEGSGTIVRAEVDHYYVLTCDHVTATGDVHYVGPPGGPFRPARLVLADAKLDLALLRVEGKIPALREVAKVAPSEPYHEADSYSKVGYPKAGPMSVLSGKPFPFWGFSPAGVKSVVVGARSIPGDSGGGLFRDRDGALVGVVWGGTGNDLWARTLEDINPFLTRAYNADRTRKPANGPGKHRYQVGRDHGRPQAQLLH